MTDLPSLGKCEVCQIRDAIGVASTSQPYSCAYCALCAQHGADPEWIFIFLLDDVADGDPSKIREGLMTYKNGEYISFHVWAEKYGKEPRASQDNVPVA